jgi:hypothetical protein
MDAALPAPAQKTRGRKTNAERFKGVPVEKVYLDLPEEEKICRECGTPRKRSIMSTLTNVRPLSRSAIDYLLLVS